MFEEYLQTCGHVKSIDFRLDSFRVHLIPAEGKIAMPRIPEDELERLKREVPLERLCGRYGIGLKAHGKDLIGHCPFHEDRTPSFVVSVDKNLWNCLGACGCGGDVIELVRKREKVSFRRACEILREMLGAAPAAVTYRTRVGSEHPILVDPAREYTDAELLEIVTSFYHESFLNHPQAMAYLQGRGCFHPEAVKRFRLGYANRTLGYRLPLQTAAGRRLREQLQRIGLYRESGHEHLSGCVVVPVFDEGGKVAELYGRRITKPKALPEGSPHMYLPGPHAGVWNAAELRHHRVWLLCEAALDALALWCQASPM